jgi:capsular polysaccharide transport system ATP-binding protein
MIVLKNVTKTYRVRTGHKYILHDADIVFPTGANVALLGRNGAGKSTLLKMIAGTVDLDRGEILRTGTISWPIGFAGSFHPDLSGAQNTRFIARVYGCDTEELLHFAREFAELGDFFDMPFRTYSAGMRSRLAFGVSMGVPFDTYLVDEVTSVGDAVFRAKCNAIFAERRKTAGTIVVSHAIDMVRKMCDCGVVLENGQLTFFENIHHAIHQHNLNLLGRGEE